MANIFLQPIYFLTIEEYKQTTTTTLTDDEINIIIYKAESFLKSYLWYNIEKTDENEKDLKEATFYIAKQIETNKETITKANINWNITSESTGDRSYNFWDITNRDILKVKWINEEAKSILDKYKMIFYKSVI